MAPTPASPDRVLPFGRRLLEATLVAGVETISYLGVSVGGRAAHPAFALRLDEEVPFVPATVWLYLPGYAACFLLTAWVVREAAAYRAALASFILLAMLSLPFFVLLPIRAPRPAFPPDGGVTDALVDWLYEADPALNTFPSLHVANVALCAAIALATDRRLGGVVALLAAAVAISTVTLKQHWVVDLPGGAALASVGYVAWRAAVGRR